MNLGKLIIDIDGPELTQEDKDILRHPNIGGVILFARNFISVDQISKLINHIKALRSPSLIIYVDQEGGRVQRFKDGLTIIPSMELLGEKYNSDPDDAIELSKNLGWLINFELSYLGVDVNTSPVLDINYSKSSVMKSRCFANSQKIVSYLAESYIKGAKETGLSLICKHYPGHGYAKADSHEILPEDNRDFKTILIDDISPYKIAIDQNISGIMTSHVLYKNFDAYPPTISRKWLQVLRNDLRFKGLIFSDDLSMKALERFGSIIDNLVRSIESGCDCIFVCNNRKEVENICENINLFGDYELNEKMLKLHNTEISENIFKSKKRSFVLDKLKYLNKKNQMEISM